MWCDWGQCCSWCAMANAGVTSSGNCRAAICTQLLLLAIITQCILGRPVPVAARSKVCVCSRSLTGIAGSSPAEGGRLSVMSVVCCQVERSLRRADHSSRGVLPPIAGRCLWSRNLKTEEATARVGLQRQTKRKKIFQEILVCGVKYILEIDWTAVCILYSCFRAS